MVLHRGHRIGSPQDQAGLTLVELLVAMVVSMLVGIAAVATSLTFNATQRQALSTGTMSSNLVTSLGGIKAQVSQAGLGFYQDGRYLCLRMNLSVNGTKYYDNAVFAPLTASIDVARFDRIGATYADEVLAGARVRLNGSVVSSDTLVNLETLLPESLVMPPTSTPTKFRAIMFSALDGSKTCTIKTVTGWAPPDVLIGQPAVLTMAASGKHNQGTFASPVTYNGLSDYVSVLGEVNWWRFRVLDPATGSAPTGTTAVGNLVVEKPLTNESAVIERDVVAFKMQYGISTGVMSSGIDQWVNPQNPWDVLDTADEVGRVRAVRMGLVVRGERARDRGADSATCSSTTPDLWVTGNDGAFTQGGQLALFKGSKQPILLTAPSPSGTDWRCFRYRTAEIVVPMRNIVYGRQGKLP